MIVNAIAVYYLFGESLNVSRVLGEGIGFILIGVYFIFRGSPRSHAPAWECIIHNHPQAPSVLKPSP